MATTQSEDSFSFFRGNLQKLDGFSTASIFKEIERAENNFDYVWTEDWMKAWRPLVLLAITAYVLMVQFGPKAMKNRQPVKCQWIANAWNTALAIFSITAVIKTSPDFFGAITETGFQGSYCQANGFYKDFNGFWVWMFHLSKLIELGDTVFLVLKKRPILFMHWYHHALVLFDSWFGYTDSGAIVRWGCWMNLAVHSAMYTYFAVQGITRRLPRYMAKMVTTLQIVQFLVGTVICIDATRLVVVLGRREQCDPAPVAMLVHLFMYASFLFLFVQFFIGAYVNKKPKRE